MLKLYKLLQYMKGLAVSFTHKEVVALCFGLTLLMVHDDNLFINIIQLVLFFLNYIFTLTLIIVGFSISLLEYYCGVTIETKLVVDFLYGFVFVHAWLYVLCRILVSLFSSFFNNKVKEYLLSTNFYILLFLLWLFW